MIKLVWRTDVHLSDTSPASRTDDWTENCFDHLNQVKMVCEKWGAHGLIDGGDLFHVKSPSRNSHKLVQRAVSHHADYPCRVGVNFGNHDGVYGDIEFLPQQPLGVLYASGVVERLYDEHEMVFEEDGVKVRVVGIPYHGVRYDMDRFTSIKKGDEDILICAAHVLASPKGGTMFEGEDIIKYSDLEHLDPDLWCFLPGTQVVDWCGRVMPIESVRDNMALQGREGSVAVEQAHPVRQVDEEVYTFDVEGVPSSLIPGVTGDHPFWVVSGMQCAVPSRSTRRCHPDKVRTSHPCTSCSTAPMPHAEWKGASRVAAGDYVALPFPKIPEDAISAPGLAKLLGFYLAEGHLIKNRQGNPVAGVGWSFHLDEDNLHREVDSLVQDHFGLETKHHSYEKYGVKCLQVCAYGKQIAEFMAEHGGQGAATKAWSSWVWRLDANSRLQLLVGWLQGDGHARSCKTEVSGCTVSSSMATQMFQLALSLGLRPYYTIRPAKKDVSMPGGHVSDSLPAHILSFYGEDGDMLSRMMGVKPPERSKTKVAGFFHEGLFWRRVRGVSAGHYTGPVYNMRTSTNEYVAGLLLTHNCFGHWHQDQGVMKIGDKTIVNIGSLTRGALSQDEVRRKPAIALLECGKDGVNVRVVRLKVKPAHEVFDMDARVRMEARDSTIEAFVASVRDTLVESKAVSLEDKIADLDIDDRVRERTLLYLEEAD